MVRTRNLNEKDMLYEELRTYTTLLYEKTLDLQEQCE